MAINGKGRAICPKCYRSAEPIGKPGPGYDSRLREFRCLGVTCEHTFFVPVGDRIEVVDKRIAELRREIGSRRGFRH